MSEASDKPDSSPQGEAAATEAAAGLDPDTPRNIVLFSDGTGNSSGKLQKTNVWRLYEALDLGYPATTTGDVQIAFYDDGVGTSSNKLLSALGGIFGFGLASNIRELYKFLCRNHRDGDKIYAFGFSRGAYTIRLLVSLVATMGIVPYRTEQELHLHTLDMWREYRRSFHANYRITDLIVIISRALLRVAIKVRRRIGRIPRALMMLWRGQRAEARDWLFVQPVYACFVRQKRPWWFREWREYWSRTEPHREQYGPDIEFVGVWDTVAAYGGPIVEITRGIDALIWPLTMPNYRLSPKVKCARHALAIDDKRDAFQPLLWDEPSETDRDSDSPRLQQVWFTGMHADVGGGYSDESLSYVSLAWMIEHAEKAGLRLLDEYRKHIFALRNVFGPLHDSRGGAGAFYRYQPRYINAWLDYAGTLPGGASVRPATQIYRDPTIDRGRYKTRGLLCEPIRLHHSVEERLFTATDGYGPNNLPSHYKVDWGIEGTSAAGIPDPKAHGPNAQRAPIRQAPVEDLYELGDRIKLRRFWYFASVAVAILIATKPWWDDLWLSDLGGTVDARTDTQIIVAALNAFLPSFAATWTNALGSDPFISAAMFIALAATLALGVRQERRMIDVARHLWNVRFGRQPESATARGAIVPAGSPWRWLARIWRGSDGWQSFLGWYKWHLLPVLFGAAMWIALAYGVLAAATQLALVWQEIRPDQCPGRDAAKPAAFGQPIAIDIANPCANLGLVVSPDTTYSVELVVTRPWDDHGNSASPDGWDSNGVISWGSKFFRRITTAPVFAPLFETRIRDPRDPAWHSQPVGDGIYMMRPQLQRIGTGNVWKGTLTTADFIKADGKQRQLYFFVNDAVLPVDLVGDRGLKDLRLFPLAGRYRNNHGTATITIRDREVVTAGTH